nr:heterogeneous nuclear ribonucleoproteins A2/B1-like isoform X2 [Parasteatoda tepidariorum]
MNTFMKVCLMVFVVAVLTACSEAQYNGYNGPARGGRGYGGGYGGRPVNQGNQGGDTSQDSDQGGYNVNYGQGDLNNNQRNQASQQGLQRNRNGGYY